MTFLAFVVAGALPLLPYLITGESGGRFRWSIALTLFAMFVVGALRSLIGTQRWWRGGIEMPPAGRAVAGIAYWSGAFVARWVG